MLFTVLTIVILTIILTAIIVKFDPNNSALGLLFGVMLGICVGLTICGMVQSHLETTIKEENKVEIYSINNEVGISGSWVLGNGHINSEMYYFYYIKGEYGYKIEKIKAQNVEVVEREDDEQVGYIVEKRKALKKDNFWFSVGDGLLEENRTTIIVVPKGTIQVQYNVSLSN